MRLFSQTRNARLIGAPNLNAALTATPLDDKDRCERLTPKLIALLDKRATLKRSISSTGYPRHIFHADLLIDAELRRAITACHPSFLHTDFTRSETVKHAEWLLAETERNDARTLELTTRMTDSQRLARRLVDVSIGLNAVTLSVLLTTFFM